jgi:hypothetical protein
MGCSCTLIRQHVLVLGPGHLHLLGAPLPSLPRLLSHQPDAISLPSSPRPRRTSRYESLSSLSLYIDPGPLRLASEAAGPRRQVSCALRASEADPGAEEREGREVCTAVVGVLDGLSLPALVEVCGEAEPSLGVLDDERGRGFSRISTEVVEVVSAAVAVGFQSRAVLPYRRRRR